MSINSLLALTALLSAIAGVQGSVISTSVFPNSACAGANRSANGGLVGIGRVKLSTGEIETHCGCPSDNLPSFSSCPTSAKGESVCNSVLDLETGSFSAACAIVPCSGSSCPSTVVNTVVVDNDDCYASDKGAIGFTTGEDGEIKCACSSESADFTACPTQANGKATCIATDPDFLGMAYEHKETVTCGVSCDEGYFLSAAGECVKHAKRASYGSSAPLATTTSSTHHHHHPHMAHPTGAPHHPSGPEEHHHHHHHGASQHHHHHHHTPGGHAKFHGSSTVIVGEGFTSTNIIKFGPPTQTPGPAFVFPPAGPGNYHSKIPGTASPLPPLPTARLRARTADIVEEIIFGGSTCAQDERSCPAGRFGDFSCVRLDDITECGGCHNSGDAVNCLEIKGVEKSSDGVTCLRGGCVVRACREGYEQTGEGECSLKA